MKQFLLFLMILSAASGSAQQASVNGRCVDRKGNGLENVKIIVPGNGSIVHYSDDQGKFQFELRPDTLLTIYFRYDSLETIRKVRLNPGQNQRLKEVKFLVISLKGVEVKGDGQDPTGNISTLPPLDLQLFPSNSVERTLIYTTAASSNNELSSNYNVRGGNYDENLVYVNDFLINRPFLTRSGQQEGLSFINTALVQNIHFSGGGFESRYGDKLSSVLDIEYKTPDSLNASLMASLLGVESHVAHATSPRFNYLAGARYRANGYLLNSLPTKGAYNPVFWDAQILQNFYITENLLWTNIVHFSSNDYRFSPETQETDFGTVNEAYRFKIFFDGQEQTRFQTMTAGTALKWKASDRTQLDFYLSAFNSDESENFDIQGQYFINLLESDPSKEEFGDSIATVGVGTFLNHARNRLFATILMAYHNGSYRINERSKLSWGLNYQRDHFDDVLSEWKLVDSAGYSLPQASPNKVELYETIKGKLALESERYTGFLQFNTENRKIREHFPVKIRRKVELEGQKKKQKQVFTDTIRQSASRFVFSGGLRAGYTSVNQEFFLTPRMSMSYYPRSYFYNAGNIRRRNNRIRLSTGLYYQPPFYRELRTFTGELNKSVKAQKSFHLVGAYDHLFSMWGRKKPFKFSTEAYYKYLWDVNPYEVDNVRTRYYAHNGATAYAYGIDFNLHGEFVQGVESFFKVGFLSTKEDILNDQYTLYYNQAGERIFFGVSEDQTVVDSVVVHPGGIPRPTDQLMNFAILFQDHMPGFERFSIQLGLNFGTRLPYGPPDFERYKDTLRQKSYFRTDLGLSYDLLNKKSGELSGKKRRFSDAILSFEVFNLMGVNNVLSKQWVQDVSGRYYSIPNYLTQRRFNLKLILRI
ncbi:MAG: Plug domain-containing protein [Bacteroidetes bacterium]|nr:MAG: Plug domain-containing protein [Bacteroidota bacterium]